MRSLYVCACVFLGACLDPTEIRPDITTDVDCAVVAKNHVALRVGSSAIETDTCTAGAASGGDNEVGDITITPSNVDANVGITVVLGVDKPTNECVLDAPDGCIVARRALRYVLHRALRLSIDLQSRCKGVACPADQTCKDGVCVSSSVDPNDAGPDAGCAADTRTDLHNCGKCGFDCSGGACVDGLCSLYPAAVTETLAPGACIAVSPLGVFVTTGDRGGIGDVLQFPLAGGNPTYAIAGAGPTFGIVASGNDVYYAASYAVAPVLGPSIMVGHPSYTGALETDGTTVCAAVMSSPGAIECTPGGVVLQAPAGQPVKLAMQSHILYATWSTGEIYRVDLGGNAPIALTTVSSPDGIAVGSLGKTEYFASSATGAVSLLTEPSLTSPLFQLARPRGLAFDSASQALYVADEGTTSGAGAVHRFVNGVTTAIATGQHAPNCIAIDATAVYWLDGSVPMKAPR